MAPFSGVSDAISNAGDAVRGMAEAGKDVVEAGTDAAESAGQLAQAGADLTGAVGGGVAETAGKVAEAGNDAAESLGNEVVDGVKDGASTIFDDDVFELDTLKDVGSSLFEGGKDFLQGKESMGGIVGGAADSLGLPDWASDLTAAAVDFGTMNYTAAIEHGSSGFSDIAAAAGHEGVADFLETTSDVTGMFNDVAGQAAMAYATGGASGGGALLEAGKSGELGKIGEVAGQAGELAEHVDVATDVAGAAGQGDAMGVGTGMLEIMGSNAGDVGAVFGDQIDAEFIDDFQRVVADNGDVMEEIFAEFGTSSQLSELPADEILAQIGRTPADAGGLAGSTAELAGAVVQGGVEAGTGIGTAVLESEAGQNFTDGLSAALAEARTTAISNEVDVTVDQVVIECASTCQGMVDVADLDPEVAHEIADTLAQLDSMSSSGSVSDIVGAQVRC